MFFVCCYSSTAAIALVACALILLLLLLLLLLPLLHVLWCVGWFQVDLMDFDDITGDELIGRTVIDLEDRWFDQRWQVRLPSL